MKIRFNAATACLAAGAMVALITVVPKGARAQTSRDAWKWPFDSGSIWNTPIGSGARYENANFLDAQHCDWDREYFIVTTASDPLRTVYYPGSWTDRDSGTTVSWLGSMRVPNSLIIADATTNPYYTPNDCSTFLQPDGHSLIQLEPTTRTTQGGAIWGYPHTGEDLFQDGFYGTHYGSGLSSIGGSIRKGELTASGNIKHVLKVNVWGERYLNYNSADSTPGYRWPAKNADGYASTSYRGANPKLEMGALLAIPKTVDINSLGLASNQAKKIAWTLQNYGAYIVDDTGWDSYHFCGEDGVQNDWGLTLADVNKLFKAMKIVDNNSGNSVGGGGNVASSLVAPPLTTRISNPGFEAQQANTQTPTGWSEWAPNGNLSSSYTETYGGSYSGNYHATHYAGSAYKIYTFQTITGLANGNYTLRARARRSGNQIACQMEAKDFGGSALSVPIPQNGAYQKIQITNINVTNGQCTIGFWSDANAGNWMYFDQVELLKM